jgi:hypothetical protein
VLAEHSPNTQLAEILPLMTPHDLTLAEMAEILSRNPGAKAELARRSGVKPNSVSSWLAGGTNANVEAKSRTLCAELLAKEEEARKAKGEANGPSARRILEGLRKGDPEVKQIIERHINSPSEESSHEE